MSTRRRVIVVAPRVAAVHPEKVRRIALSATSGGLDLPAYRAADWREEYRRTYPTAASWITDSVPDHSAMMAGIAAPTLLLWADSDPISPLPAGEHLARLLPRAMLRVIRGASHGFARDQPRLVASWIAAHLA